MLIHGSWDIKRITHNILAIKVFDAWNVEAALAFGEELKEAAEPLLGKDWAIILSSLQGDVVAPPEVIPVIQQLNKWCIDHGCRCEAHIVKSNLQRDFNQLTRTKEALRTQDDSASSPVKYTHAYFDNLEDASDFLSQYGYELSDYADELSLWFAAEHSRLHF